MGARITWRGVVYPWLCDAMGHLATRHYMAMFDDAAYHFLYEIGWRPAQDHGTGWADVRHVVEYKRELRAGALVTIATKPLAAGRSSVRCLHILSEVGESDASATLEATTVRFDLTARKATPLDDAIRIATQTWIAQCT